MEEQAFDDGRYMDSFQIIAYAGDAKSLAHMAVEAARKFDFIAAKERLEEAELEMRKAHQLQISMIQKEAQGEHLSVDIILVHAQDHLAMAMMAKESADELVMVYQILHNLMK